MNEGVLFLSKIKTKEIKLFLLFVFILNTELASLVQ